ncbi:hypothetical protein [Microbacterium sp. CH12i]|nr:hypothetical protein [Microbacterium sp. CH12i]
MTLLQEQLDTVASVSPGERAERLTDAGTTWNERIARDAPMLRSHTR